MTEFREEEVALYIDFENLHLSAQALGSAVRAIEWQRILEALGPYGRLSIRRAYANWGEFARHQRGLMDCAILPVQAVGRGKNVADTLIVMDVMETLFNKPQVTTFVIASGDTDFTFLVQRLRAQHKQVIGVGIRHSTAAWLAQACDHFIYYDDLIDVPRLQMALRRQLLAVVRDEWQSAAAIINDLRRLNPHFDEEMRQAGYEGFRELLTALGDVVSTRLLPQGDLELQRTPRGNGGTQSLVASESPPVSLDEAGYIEAARRQQLLIVPSRARPEIVFRAHDLMLTERPATLTALKQRLHDSYRDDSGVDARVVQSVVYQLFYAYTFDINRQGEGRLWDRPFKLSSAVTSRQEMLRLTDMDILRRISRELPDGAAALDPLIAGRLLYGRNDHPAIVRRIEEMRAVLVAEEERGK